MPPVLLIVDDNESVRESLAFLFEYRGYQVLAAESGARALEIARTQRVDGALVDYNMPEMNGLEASRALLAQAQKLGRPLIVWMMSGAATADVIRGAKDVGARRIFSKPFEFSDLLQSLDDGLKPGLPPPAPGA